jgi:hypothetical protein
MAPWSLSGVSWYVDVVARERGEPGLHFSYLAAVASVLQARGEAVDPTWLLGASGWAFRINVERQLCPSAMSIFPWASILPESVRNAGWECTYVSRLWHEDAVRAERQAEAHAAIVKSLQGGTPAVAWDLLSTEWGLITGYDEGAQTYDVLAPTTSLANTRAVALQPEQGVRRAQAPCASLGEREIRLVSVTVPGSPNHRPRDLSVRNALEAAARHAEQAEWNERPQYQDGLPAYEQWARFVAEHTGSEWALSEYYSAGHWAGARCYARDFLRREAESCPDLRPAANAYASVASRLLDVWRALVETSHSPASKRQELAAELREAGRYEQEGVAAIIKHLAAA